MKTSFTKRGSGIMMPLAFLISVSLFLSCTKIDLVYNNKQQAALYTSPAEKVNSTVNGFVTNENNQPVSGAVVMAGSKSVVTDNYGFFEISNADVQANVAVVTVNMPGYFPGIKNCKPTDGQDAFFRIKLIPKTIAGNFNASGGGIVSLQNGLSISFTANSIVYEASGKAYNGKVNVAAFWINPAEADLIEIMPGDLRGVDAAGEMKKLTSYGMAAVELTGGSGEKLQLAAGKPAILTMPMSNSISTNAPLSIPLWHFDEAKGLWIEEGSAVKKGNVYVGAVSHFSFWNCDWPGDYVEFDCTVITANEFPLNNVRVMIHEVSNPANATGGFTNAQGFVSGMVPANTVLRLDVLGEGSCVGVPVYSQTFTTTNSNVSMTVLIENTSAGVATVSGTVKDCNNNLVNNGRVFMKKNGNFYHYPVNNGNYNFTSIVCNNISTQVSLMAHDAAASVYSPETNYTINSGSNNIIDIQACGNYSPQFINYSINGVQYKFTYPASAFIVQNQNENYNCSVLNDVTNEAAGILFSVVNMAPGSLQPLNYFAPNQINGAITPNNPILISITETGDMNQHVAGNFSGTFTGPAPEYRQYNITCYFRLECIF